MGRAEENWVINTIVEYVKRRSSLWRKILEVLYDYKGTALAIHEIHQKYAEKYKIPPEVIDRRSILQVLKKLERLELIRLVQIKGLRGKRWIITEKGIEVYKRLREQ